MKVLENELKEKIKIFTNTDITVQIKDLIDVEFNMYNVHISYEGNMGYLNIADYQNNLNFYIGLASSIDISNNTLYIKSDSSLEIKIIMKSNKFNTINNMSLKLESFVFELNEVLDLLQYVNHKYISHRARKVKEYLTSIIFKLENIKSLEQEYINQLNLQLK